MKSLTHKNFLWVHYRGKVYKIDCSKKQNAATDDGEEQPLIAPFSCKIVKVYVSEGEKIKKGSPVVTVEAMKMEYTYNSPREGTVGKVLVTAGQIVTEGASFIEWA